MRLFFSYAQSDESFRHQLAKHLSLLKREGILDTWDAYEITAGTDRAQAIETHLNTADIILLLISADFIASDCYDTEMQSAIARHERGEAQVIPILLRPCDWESAPFGKLQLLPRGGTPITSCKDSEAALAEIAQEIRRVAIARNPALAKTPKSLLKPSAPFPGVRLPENFVPRAEAFDAVKQKLLADDDRALVVSAIAGLGGLGKSVLAAALVLDAEVQARFADGILWVTLGQNPDLQNLLGDWIRTLDKSRESYSATTLEAASSYLRSLLIEKRMLLVVDDAWNGAHVEHFRVGGAECRVLVTTREAQIDGADYHALDLMTEEEAIALVRQKLKRQWKPEQEAEVKAFAKSLGYLPLALDLAANQVRDGLSWGELRQEFEDERKAVALEVLDSSEAWEHLDEKEQRKYSLQACFQLSLRRLKPEQLRQFAWLGVLPEDVSLDGRMAVTLWNLPKLKAKKALIDLLNRSFLTSGTETLEGEPTYRVHDLMHDTARGVIEQGALGDSIQNLASAHGHLLERYRQKHDRWDRLPNDGYIHRHLTWHFVQAGLEDEVHALMAMSDEQGRNAWFESCERIGQPAIFVQDVKRGWEVAEQGYEQDKTQSIVLQCRYALMTATLNSLVNSLPIGMMAEFVKGQYWTPEQAWAYVEQMQDESKVAEAIEKLAPYLPKSIFGLVLEAARSIQDEDERAWVLSALAQVDAAYFPELLEAARSIQDEYSRAWVLSALAQVDAAYLPEALEAARSIQNESRRAEVLSALAQVDAAYLPEALEAARSIQDESRRAEVLSALAQVDAAYLPEALEAARSIQNESSRAEVLSALAQVDAAYFPELLEAARSIQNESRRAEVLSALAQVDAAYFPELLEAARSIQNESSRAEVLSALAQVDAAYFPELLEAARSIQDEDSRAKALSALAQVDAAYFPELLEAARSIQNEDSRAEVLSALAQVDAAYFPELLEAARSIQNEYSRAWVLSALAQVDAAYFPELLEAARSIQDESSRAEVLSALARVDAAYLPEALEAARSIQDEYSRAWVLSALAQVDAAYLPEALEAARSIQDESSRAEVLSALAQVDAAYFPEALEAARSIQDEDERAWVLSAFAQVDAAYLPEALEAARSIQSESWRAKALSAFAQVDAAYLPEALEAARSIQDESSRAEVLSALAQVDAAYFPELLEAARSIQNEYSRAWVLSAFAQVDAAYFPELLEAARSIQDEYSRAWVLSALAQVDAAYLPEALEAARSIQNESRRAEVLSALAQVDAAYFPEALEAARSIQDESSRAWVLSALAQKSPEGCLSQAFVMIDAINHKPTRAEAFSTYLPRLPLATLSPTDWQTHLHLLAYRTRADLMQDLATLHPAISHLGGKEVIRGMVDVMHDVCQQWK